MTKRLQLALVCCAFVGVALALVPFARGRAENRSRQSSGHEADVHVRLRPNSHAVQSHQLPFVRANAQGTGRARGQGRGGRPDHPGFRAGVRRESFERAAAEGFNSIAWYIPGVAFAIGLGIVITLIRLWRQRDVARLATASERAARSAYGGFRAARYPTRTRAPARSTVIPRTDRNDEA